MDIKEYISSGILESYILGLASPEEASILECVIKNNSEVKAAFEEAQITLEHLAKAQAMTPPEDLKSKIWSKIQMETLAEDERPIIPISNQTEPEPEVQVKSQQIPVHEKPNRDSFWKNFAVAASLLVLITSGAAFFYFNQKSQLEKNILALQNEQKVKETSLQTAEKKLAVLTNPDMKKVVLKGVEKHPQAEATVMWDTKTKEVYLTTNKLPAAPQDMEYQLWAIADGKPVSAGMYTEDKDGKIALATIENAQAFAITLEKKGGSPEPTMENMYVMGGV